MDLNPQYNYVTNLPTALFTSRPVNICTILRTCCFLLSSFFSMDILRCMSFVFDFRLHSYKFISCMRLRPQGLCSISYKTRCALYDNALHVWGIHVEHYHTKFDRSTARPLDRSTARPLDRSTARPLDRSTARPLDRSTARPFEPRPFGSLEVRIIEVTLHIRDRSVQHQAAINILCW